MASITSAQLNYLVFRYLQESGFIHSAFSLGYEAGINKSTIDGNMVPPSALVTLVQRGLQYLEMEANISNTDTDVEEDFSFLEPLDLITKDVYELRKIIRDKKKSFQKENDKEAEKEHEAEQKRLREKDRHEKEKDHEKGRERIEKNKEPQRQWEDHMEKVVLEDRNHLRQEENGPSVVPEPVDASPVLTSQPCEIPATDVMILEGHTSEVFACAWRPTGSVLASGSGDSTARIWSIPESTSKSIQSGPLSVLVLKHVKGRTNEKSKDVTTLDWNGDGTLLATGSYDGQARIWSTNACQTQLVSTRGRKLQHSLCNNPLESAGTFFGLITFLAELDNPDSCCDPICASGELRTTLSKHKGPIFSLKWNKKGDYLLTGSCDKTAIVWDVKAEEGRQQFEFHSGPTLDVDWRNNVSFATSSTDNMIYVCKIGENRPIKAFAGHQGEVNCVKWDPTGSLLASCSDDITAKIWCMKQEKYVHDLREHTKEIYTLRWSPTGPGTNNPNHQLVLASASFDSTVKLWDVELGKLIHSLNGHRDPVYSVAFSPNGEYLASGSLDKSVHIWSLKEGKIIKTYTGNGGIFEVCWNKEGDKISACFANNTVCVIDFRM